MVILAISLGGVLAGISVMLRQPTLETTSGVPGFAWAAIAAMLAVLCFFFWPLYSTYYTIGARGLEVRYGPWVRQYSWSEFATAYWQRGMFATRIGWPTITPCVRLTNCVLLKRRAKGFGLYLTPNDPKAFLQRMAEFAPELTAELV
jgi:hypothetical protein